jgi:hypothetical protein
MARYRIFFTSRRFNAMRGGLNLFRLSDIARASHLDIKFAVEPVMASAR